MKETVIIYSKDCLECTYKGWYRLRNYLMCRKEYIVKERRTVLNPIWHKLASKAYGDENYPPFALFEDKTIKTIKELEMSYNGEEKELSKMRWKTNEPTRMDRVARRTRKTKKEA